MISPVKTQICLHNLFLFFVVLCLSSCEKEPDYKKAIVDEGQEEIQINTGFTDKEVHVGSDSWKVVYVKNINPTQYLLDIRQQLMKLSDFGRVDCSKGFISLEKKATDPTKLYISMTENFREEPRRILIGIEFENSVKQIEITQNTAGDYEMTDKIVVETPNSLQIKTQRLSSKTVDNKASTAITMTTPIKEFFKEASSSSEFTSDVVVTYDWVPGPDSLISMLPLMYQGVKYWDEKVKFKKWTVKTPYLANANTSVNKVIAPYSKLTVYGEVTYASRECTFQITIKNKTTGFVTDLRGKWKQTVPIKSEIKTI